MISFDACEAAQGNRIDISECCWHHVVLRADLHCIVLFFSGHHLRCDRCSCGLWYPRSTQPGHPWVGAMSTSQRVVTLCSWGVKAGMVCVWVAVKTVWSSCYTQVISEHFDVVHHDKALYKYWLLYWTSLVLFT